MDIIITPLTKQFLEINVDSFIQILKNEPYEYWTEKNFLKEFTGKFDLSLSAFHNKQLVGYIIASLKGKTVYVHKFMVDSSYRNHKIGSLLQSRFEESIIKQNYSVIELSVLSENIGALRFYKKKGYKEIDSRIDILNKIELKILKKQLK